LIAAQADSSNKSKKLLWKQLRLTEQARNMARAVRAALQDQWHICGLLAVIGPTRDGPGRQEYMLKGELEQACIDEAGRRFTQALDTPLLIEPLVNLFGESG